VPVDGPTYRAGWAALREAGHKEDFSPPHWAADLWRWQAAAECVRAGEWAGALVHLDRSGAAERASALGQVYRGDALHGLRRREEAVTTYTRAIERGSKDSAAWFGRGEARGELGRWVEAAEDFARAKEAGASPTMCDYRQALTLLAAGKGMDYRRLCERLLPGEAAHGEASNVLRAWLYLLAPEGGIDPAGTLKKAEEIAVRGSPTPEASAALEAALYRAGRMDDPRWGRNGVTLAGQFFRAMRLSRLGKAGEAQKALAVTVREAADGEADGATEWTERVELRLLREEAEKLNGLPKP
jgi:tetratricopeptide (TPR) repeat protein